jgi:predicted XRE-type DNA-binding protein
MSDSWDATPSSGNVFADLDCPNAEEAQLKAELCRRISGIIRHRGWTQLDAAEALGIDQPKVSAITRGRLSGFSIERLYRCLQTLDPTVTMVLGPVYGNAAVYHEEAATRGVSSSVFSSDPATEAATELLRREQERIGFLAVPALDYVKALERAAGQSLTRALTRFHVGRAPAAMTGEAWCVWVTAMARFCREMGLTLRETDLLVRLELARDAGHQLMPARHRRESLEGCNPLEVCEEDLATVERCYCDNERNRLDSAEAAVRAVYRE